MSLPDDEVEDRLVAEGYSVVWEYTLACDMIDLGFKLPTTDFKGRWGMARAAGPRRGESLGAEPRVHWAQPAQQPLVVMLRQVLDYKTLGFDGADSHAAIRVLRAIIKAAVIDMDTDGLAALSTVATLGDRDAVLSFLKAQDKP